MKDLTSQKQENREKWQDRYNKVSNEWLRPSNDFGKGDIRRKAEEFFREYADDLTATTWKNATEAAMERVRELIIKQDNWLSPPNEMFEKSARQIKEELLDCI